MDFNAIILSGGRSSRLGGTPKAGLSNGQQTLLDRTLDAVADAVSVVVVGPADLPVPQSVILTREEPVFSGPAAAIGAGILAVPASAAEWTMVLGVDMPAIAGAVETLRNTAVASHLSDHLEGWAGVTEGIFQPLTGIYRTDALRRAFAYDTADRSVRKVLARMNYSTVDLPARSTDDVDTWDAARRLGFTEPIFES